MGLVVHKYGGTSVGSIERIQNVAKKIAREKENNDVVVIVSAMAGETNRLLALAGELSSDPPKREMDMLLSTGERVTISLLSIALNEIGLKVKSLTGRQVGIITDNVHTDARIQEIRTDKIKQLLKKGYIPVVAGFQGITESGEEVTTLGRGGSDTTAVALAASLKADMCHIYTDVDGVYTADPSIVPQARKIDKITCEEMVEMASMGAKVLHVRSVHFAIKYNVPLKVASSFLEEGSGTMVVKEVEQMEQVVVSGVAVDKNQSKITIAGLPDKPGVAFSIFEALSEKNINIDMIIQNVSHDNSADISFTVTKNETDSAVKVLKSLPHQPKDIMIINDIAKVSIIGAGMTSQPGVAAKMFGTLAKEGINLLMISTSEIKISCVIELKYAELAVRDLHTVFNLDRK